MKKMIMFLCLGLAGASLSTSPDFVTVSPKNHQRTKVRYVDAVS